MQKSAVIMLKGELLNDSFSSLMNLLMDTSKQRKIFLPPGCQMALERKVQSSKAELFMVSFLPHTFPLPASKHAGHVLHERFGKSTSHNPLCSQPLLSVKSCKIVVIKLFAKCDKTAKACKYFKLQISFSSSLYFCHSGFFSFRLSNYCYLIDVNVKMILNFTHNNRMIKRVA